MLETTDVRMLVDLGFMALSHGQEIHATEIFEGVKAARPQQEAGHIGCALVLMYRNDINAAEAVLRQLPPSDAVTAFHGLALARMGAISEARNKLAGLLRTAPGTPFAQLAKETISALCADRSQPTMTGRRL